MRKALATLTAFLLPAVLLSTQVGAQESTQRQPGDVVVEGKASVVVPARGFGVVAHVLAVSGASEELMVSTSPTGEVTVDEMDTTEQAGSNDPCNDGAFNLIKHRHSGSDHRIKWYDTMHWRFNRQTTPSQTTADRAESALRAATTNITGSQDSCGMSDNVSASGQYEGDADQNAAIGADGRCNNPNGGSQVSFGDLNDPDKLAVACEWFTTDRTPHAIIQADVKLDNRSNWYAPGLETCNDDWSIEAVATHERGHSYGLAHVSESGHPNLTMSRKNNGKCQNSESSLGRGDVLGLRELY